MVHFVHMHFTRRKRGKTALVGNKEESGGRVVTVTVTMSGDSKLTKNQRRRLKKKLEKHVASSSSALSASVDASASPVEEAPPADVAVEYVSLDVTQELANAENDPAYAELLRVFGTFSSAEELCGQPVAATGGDAVRS